MTTIVSNKRVGIGRNSCKKLRTSGNIPAIIYGAKQDAVAISVSLEAFQPYAKSKEQMNIKLEDGREEAVVIKQVQYDPLLDTILHVDFYRVVKS